MGWFAEKFEKFRKQSLRVIFTLIFAKFLFGVGLGVLLASYFQAYDWILCGWLLIVISLLLHIPVIYITLIKK
ncbi:MAG: hypothetical protein QMD14_05320 [Candidatus Aenigmarchaeota archaeon]|nr:hypothetical protein [Candidatus Aenigmarchaeota archaeon]